MRGNNFYGVIDQVVSSSQNFVLLVIVGRSVDASSFGAFAVAYAAAILVVGLGQALVGEATLIYLGAHPEDARSITGTSIVLSLLLSLFSAAFLESISGILGSEQGHLFHLLAFSISGLVVQDNLRFALIAQKKARAALASDLAWVLAWIAVSLLTTARSSGAHLLDWSGTSAVGALLALLLARPKFGWVGFLGDVRKLRRFVGSLFFEWLFLTGSVQIVVFALAGIVGLAATGGLRAAQSVFGPVTTLINAVRLVFIREIAERAAGPRPSRAILLAVRLGLSCGGLSAAVTLGAIVLSSKFGGRLYGQTWALAAPLLVPIGLQRVVNGTAIGASAYLRGTGQVARAVKARAVGIGLETSLAIGLAPLGILFSAYGLLVGSTVGGCLLWLPALDVFIRSRGPAFTTDRAEVAMGLVRFAPSPENTSRVQRIDFASDYTHYVSLRVKPIERTAARHRRNSPRV